MSSGHLVTHLWLDRRELRKGIFGVQKSNPKEKSPLADICDLAILAQSNPQPGFSNQCRKNRDSLLLGSMSLERLRSSKWDSTCVCVACNGEWLSPLHSVIVMSIKREDSPRDSSVSAETFWCCGSRNDAALCGASNRVRRAWSMESHELGMHVRPVYRWEGGGAMTGNERYKRGSQRHWRFSCQDL